MKPVVYFSIIRIAVFAVVLAVLLLLTVPGYLAAIFAALIAFCVSYLFLGRQRDAVAAQLAASRARPERSTVTTGGDEDAEDALEGDGPREAKAE